MNLVRSRSIFILQLLFAYGTLTASANIFLLQHGSERSHVWSTSSPHTNGGSITTYGGYGSYPEAGIPRPPPPPPDFSGCGYGYGSDSLGEYGGTYGYHCQYGSPSPLPPPPPPSPSPSPPPPSYGYGYDDGCSYGYTTQFHTYSYTYQTTDYGWSCPEYGGYGGYGGSGDGYYHSGASHNPITLAPPTPSSPSTSLSATPSSADTMAPGTCYCPYDQDWNWWAISDPVCRAALYRRCDKDARLPCAWLDTFFAVPQSSSVSRKPHEDEISLYLFNDCPPAPPCQCVDQQLHRQPSNGSLPSYPCCQQLAGYARVPFSGITEPMAQQFCLKHTSTISPQVQRWVEMKLWHTTCPASPPSGLYSLVADPLLSDPSKAVSRAAGGPAIRSSSKQGGASKAAVIGGVAAGSVAAGVLLGVGAAMMAKKLRRRPTHQPLLDA